MIFIDYLKDKILSVFIGVCLIVITTILLIAFSVNIFLIVYIPLFIGLSLIFIFLYDFFKKRNWYNTILSNLEKLDKKFLIQEITTKPDFLEGKLFYEIMQEVNRSMIENINEYKFRQEDFREYIEMWVHEIKTPISSSKLIIENNKTSITENIDEELDKIDNFVEQVLYYSRSDNVQKDYIIKKVNLEQVVNTVILKNKKDFISKKIILEIKGINEKVNSDSKWLEYIINQIIINSIKYLVKENAKIKIYCKKNKENIKLYIEDNGIGIEKKDLNRVFEKGFTGLNGRSKYNSTGMGLYLCKKLCDKLDHSIDITSKKNEFTTIELTFPISTFTSDMFER